MTNRRQTLNAAASPSDTKSHYSSFVPQRELISKTHNKEVNDLRDDNKMIGIPQNLPTPEQIR